MEPDASRGRRPIRVLLSAGRAQVRAGLRAILSTYADVEVVGEAENGGETLILFTRLRPDVVVIDLMLEGTEDWSVIRKLKAEGVGGRLVVLTLRPDLEFRADTLGVDAVLTKGFSADALWRSIAGPGAPVG